MTEIVFPEFPHYLKVYMNIKDDNVTVTVHSTVHVNKKVVMPHSWSEEYIRVKPQLFRADIRAFIIKSYGLVKQPTSYV